MINEHASSSAVVMVVATHKAAPLPRDDFYLPIHVGRALSTQNLGFQPDDEGENISALNASYCELTALYWAWKNIDSEYIGLSHYRRFFIGSQLGPNGSKILSRNEARRIMGSADLLLGKPRNYVIESVDSHYRNGHYGGDIDAVRAVIAEQTPQMLSSFDQVFMGRKLSLFNMFLMSREHFDNYAGWLFAVLEELGNRIDNSNRSEYQQRTFGYVAERLLNVWALAQPGLRTEYRRIINSEGEAYSRKAIGLLKRKFSKQKN